MERLKSRKLWLTIIAGVVVSLGEQFGLDLDPEQVISLGGLIAAYVLGEAQVDKQRVQAEVAASVNQLKSEANAIISGLVEKLQEIQAPAQAPKAPDANTELYQG